MKKFMDAMVVVLKLTIKFAIIKKVKINKEY